MRSKDAVRVGSGAGTSDDRLVPALELAERGDIDYLVFECLAERTVSRENLSRSKDPDQGYSPSLHARLRMVLPTCIGKGIRIVNRHCRPVKCSTSVRNFMGVCLPPNSPFRRTSR